MQAVGLYVVPECSSREVSEGIVVVVDNHLRFTAGAAREVHNHVILCASVVNASQLCHCRVDGPVSFLNVFFRQRKPPFRYFRADADALFHGWTFRIGIIDMFDNLFVATSNDGLDVCLVATIDNVLVSQQVGGRDDHCSYLMQRNDERPELVAALEDTHHHIVFLDTDTREVRHNIVAHSLHISKCIATFFALVIRP